MQDWWGYATISVTCILVLVVFALLEDMPVRRNERATPQSLLARLMPPGADKLTPAQLEMIFLIGRSWRRVSLGRLEAWSSLNHWRVKAMLRELVALDMAVHRKGGAEKGSGYELTARGEQVWYWLARVVTPGGVLPFESDEDYRSRMARWKRPRPA